MKIYREITPVTSSDVFVLLDSINKGFDYPIHNHPEYELNLVMGASGKRIVGDSTRKYHQSDLALIGPYLFHKWDNSIRKGTIDEPCRVITIQFDMHLFESQFLLKQPFHQIRALLKSSYRGIQFKGKTFEKARDLMIRLADASGIERVTLFLQLLDFLSKSVEIEYLASEGFDITSLQTSSTRLHAAYQYLIKNFTRQSLNIEEVASKVNLSGSAFSHFFKKCTNKNFTRFLIDMRLGYACKLLVSSDDLISQICFQSGFNNVSNFNRLFKKYHHCSPYEFRKLYQDKGEFDWTDQITPGQFLPGDRPLSPASKPQDYATRLVHS